MAVGPGTIPHLGERPLVLKAVYAEMFAHEGGAREALFYLDDASSGRLRDITDAASAGEPLGIAILLRK